MNLNIDNILLIGSLLLMISVWMGRTSFRFGMPALLFFVIIGMLAGSEGIGGINFDNARIAQFIGIMALNFILFSGGLETQWKSVRPVLSQGLMLSTLGVLLTATLVGIFVHAVTDFSFPEALLLGSIVSSTDAAAVFSILRSKSLALKNRLRPTLELESGSNDCMAYFLTITLTGIVAGKDLNAGSLFVHFLLSFSVGGIIGLAWGIAGKYILNRAGLGFDGLYPVMMIAIMFLSFSTSEQLHGNGFLSVYVAAIYLGNQEYIHKRSIFNVFDGLAWLMQIILFLTLGLLVFPSQVIPVIGTGLLISAFLILVGRPLSVYLSLLPFRMNNRRKLFISWVGLRGAVPIVFATYPMLAGIEKAGLIFNIVFFVSLTSVLIQGTGLPVIAKILGLILPSNIRTSHYAAIFSEYEAKSEIRTVRIEEANPSAGKRIVDLKLPGKVLITMLKRDGQYLLPNGATQLNINDQLTLLAEDKTSLDTALQSLGIILPENED